MMNIVEKARVFATAAHAGVGQIRKYTGEPYIVHPTLVAALVKGTPYCTDAMIAAAYLHDVLEDTQVTKDVMLQEFGDEVTNLVVWMTKVGEAKHGNRAIRKEMDRQFLAKAPAQAQTIKIADLIANTDSIVEHDPNFAKVYLREKKDLLEVLTLGDPTLMVIAKLQIEKGMADIEKE